MAENSKSTKKEYSFVDDFKNGKIKRRHIRKQLFLIKRNGNDYDNDIKQYYANLLDPKKGQTWSTFSFTWDVGAKDPLTVVTVHDWVASGGKIDVSGNCVPPAFTKQEF